MLLVETASFRSFPQGASMETPRIHPQKTSDHQPTRYLKLHLRQIWHRKTATVYVQYLIFCNLILESWHIFNTHLFTSTFLQLNITFLPSNLPGWLIINSSFTSSNNFFSNPRALIESAWNITWWTKWRTFGISTVDDGLSDFYYIYRSLASLKELHNLWKSNSCYLTEVYPICNNYLMASHCR